MSAPHSRHHAIDIWNPVVHVQWMGDPTADVVAMLKADGWEVDLYEIDAPVNPNASTRERARIVTLQARYDYVPVASRGGRVVAIGHQAPFTR